jgi:S-DNA-T family DNA segregation ATPase FtsK/SpoIIIE
MARKESRTAPHAHGWNDVVGIALIAAALLLLVAQLSFDPLDVAVNRAPPNETTHNWVGGFGAWMANGLFKLFGAGAFVAPFLMLAFGLGHLFELLAYLKRRWAWGVVLFICCIGLLDLYTDKGLLARMGARPDLPGGFLEQMSRNINAPGAGGFIGSAMNSLLFGHFGTVGATIIFGALYLISLICLTNFRLGDWLRELWARRSGPEAAGDWSSEERELARKAEALQREARKLQEQVDRRGLGADLKPVPAPTVRDLSVPSPRARTPARAKPTEPEVEKIGQEGEVITAREIAAASTVDILGRPMEPVGKAAPPPAKFVEPAGSARPLEAAAAEAQPDDEPAPVVEAEKLPAPAMPRGAPPESVTITDNTSSKARKARKKPLAVAAAPAIGNYQLPPVDLLQLPDTTLKPTESKEELMANARLMQSTLAQFDIEVSLGDITKGPTITRYELHPAPGVKLEKITALNNNLAAALKAERIHILAPVPGKSSVGVEVPNLVKTKVILRDLMESEEWQKTKARIPLALGKDVYGHPIIGDLSDMPHLLIAGSTGSGKSVCINAIIASLLYRFPPDHLRFVMIDPKVVELQHYNNLPHLVVPVVTDPKKVILALRWVVNEMEKRYQIFAKVGVRNIKSFNERPRGRSHVSAQPELPLLARKEKIEAGADGFAVEVDEDMVAAQEEEIVIPERLSYIVVIIDELADLMLVAPADVEMAIARITQMARAAGIHCIVATQRPSVDVITGVIKANIPARIAFQVAAKVDSRTILDAMGADKLLGKGDMLYLPPGSAKLIRAQGALITDQELQAVVEFIARQGKPAYEVEIHQQLSRPISEFEADNGNEEDESLIQQCIEVIRSEQKASVSLLQRRLRLGYTRAARIMDTLEERGIVGPSKGAEPRDILIDLDQPDADEPKDPQA